MLESIEEFDDCYYYIKVRKGTDEYAKIYVKLLLLCWRIFANTALIK